MAADELLNDLDNLTFRQLIKIIGKIKIKVLIAIASFLIACIFFLVYAGSTIHSKHTALTLNKPFSMQITIKDGDEEITGEFENSLILIKDPDITNFGKGKIRLVLRQEISEFEVIPIGMIIAREEQVALPTLPDLLIRALTNLFDPQESHAQSNFSWRGHRNDYNYREIFVNKSTVQRSYSDGCVLQYNVDGSGRSIPSSFKWVKTTH